MVDDEILNKMHVSLVQLGNQILDVLHGPVRGIDSLVIRLEIAVRAWFTEFQFQRLSLTMSYPISFWGLSWTKLSVSIAGNAAAMHKCSVHILGVIQTTSTVDGRKR